MKLFDVAQVVHGEYLNIPYGMRAALGWHTNAQLFWWRQPGAATDFERSQIALSAFVPHSRELWNLSARFADRPGMMAELAQLLTSHQINIVSCRASTELQNTSFGVEMELDVSLYRSELDFDTAKRRELPGRGLRELHARIVATFIREAQFEPDGTPSISITRNPVLTGAIYSDDFHDNAQLHHSGDIAIPSAVLQSAQRHFANKHGHVAEPKGRAADPCALIVADARWGVCDVSFFYRNTGYRHVRLQLQDQIGAIQRICAELRDRDFNILQLYSRAIHKTGGSLMDLFLQSNRDLAGSDSDLARFIQAALKSNPLRELLITSTFPPPHSPLGRRRR